MRAGSRKAASIAILGGGCAGLALAQRLVSDAPDAPHVVVIEPRSDYRNDRTWAFWDGFDDDPLVDDLITKRWQHWYIGNNDRGVIQSSAHHDYAVIPAGSFYEQAAARIASSENVALHQGIAVESVQEKARSVEITTNGGTYAVDWVIDTRPPSRNLLQSSILFQVFKGVEVVSDKPVFDDTSVELMTDMRCDRQGFIFSYVLPFDPCHALIEVTRFSEIPIMSADLDEAVDDAIAARLGQLNYRIVRREQGILPMGMPARSSEPNSRIVNAGTAAGASRAATGYAFMRIQRWASKCAERIVAGEPPMPHPREPFLRDRMDHLFLQVIRQDPALAPRLFLDLGSKLDPDCFARFLSDKADWSDLLAVVTSLPPTPFLRSLVGAPTALMSSTRAEPV